MKIIQIIWSLLCAIIFTAFLSCENEEPYHSPLVGEWVYCGNTNNVPIVYDILKLTYNSDGTGYETTYNAYLNSWSTPTLFNWEESKKNNINYIHYFYEDYSHSNGWEIRNDTLIIYPLWRENIMPDDATFYKRIK